MKEIRLFKIGEEIPSNATFLCRGEVSKDMRVPDEFFYEVPIKAKKTTATKEEDRAQLEVIERVLTYLNRKTGGRFTIKNKAASKDIKARLSEDVKPEDFKTVVDNMCDVWLGNEEMNKYLRPSTLFGNKFYDYLRLNDGSKELDKVFEGLDAINAKVLEDEKGTV